MIHRILYSLLVLIIAMSISAAPTVRTIILKVSTPETVWHDADFEQHIIRSFTQSEDIRVVDSRTLSDEYPPFPDDSYNFDTITGWGQEIGGRYLLFVEIHSERLEKRKSFHLPLVFHKYETVGVIEGDIRVIDLTRSKLLLAEPIKVEKKGPRIFQATMDDDINDPDIHITSPDKLRFFKELEKIASKEIIKKTKAVIGRRDIDTRRAMR